MADPIIAIDALLEFEGKVYEQVHGDRGGRTYWGISEAGNPQWPGFKLLDKLKPLAGEGSMPMSVPAIDQLVYDFYAEIFDKMRLGEVNSQKIANQIFQAVINFGGKPVKWAQEIIGVAADGIIGPKTIAAINSMKEKDFVEQFLRRQIARYESIVERDFTQARFLKGWMARAHAFAK